MVKGERCILFISFTNSTKLGVSAPLFKVVLSRLSLPIFVVYTFRFLAVAVAAAVVAVVVGVSVAVVAFLAV